jgi:hypothetical protein
MTAEEWSSCDNLRKMLSVLRGKVDERKNRLFNAACCRRLWPLYSAPAVRQAILTGELYADGRVDREQLRDALRAIHRARASSVTGTPVGLALQAAGYVAAEFRPDWALQSLSDSSYALLGVAPTEQLEAARKRVEQANCDLLREVFGNPFRRVSVNPVWLTPGVRAVTTAIYEDRDFAAMPILADALEEAGCDEAAILDHLRGPNNHVRGCWALDLILGRE